MPTYNDVREYCGFPRIRNFEELDKYFLPGVAKLFSQIYKNVDDIDFVIAGQAENLLLDPGVFTCINVEQFRRTRSAFDLI